MYPHGTIIDRNEKNTRLDLELEKLPRDTGFSVL